MRILIVSDTHRHNEDLHEVINKVGRIDMLIHCGDIECQAEDISCMVECPTVIVRGNNDFFARLEKEDVFNIDSYKIMVTHGHHYNVSLGVDMLVDEALSRGVNVVMYGHTHRPHLEIRDDITIINPGSISYPRQEGRRGTYMVMEIDKFGEAHYKLCYV